MKERVKLVLAWEKFAELCRELGISRAVGYDWVGRYRDAKCDVKAIKERSRRLHHSPTKVDPSVRCFAGV